jgi:hypothetical protein
MKRITNNKLNIQEWWLPRCMLTYTERITAISERIVLTEVHSSSDSLSKSPKAFQGKMTRTNKMHILYDIFLFNRISRNSRLIKLDYQNACNIRCIISIFVIFTHGLRFLKLSSLSVYKRTTTCVTFHTWCCDLMYHFIADAGSGMRFLLNHESKSDIRPLCSSIRPYID